MIPFKFIRNTNRDRHTMNTMHPSVREQIIQFLDTYYEKVIERYPTLRDEFDFIDSWHETLFDLKVQNYEVRYSAYVPEHNEDCNLKESLRTISVIGARKGEPTSYLYTSEFVEEDDECDCPKNMFDIELWFKDDKYHLLCSYDFTVDTDKSLILEWVKTIPDTQ